MLTLLKRSAIALAILLAVVTLTWATWRQSWSGQMLQDAIERDDVERAALILSMGGRTDTLDGDGASPLGTAASGGHPQLVQMLLARGMNPDERFRLGTHDANLTPIMTAAGNRRNESETVLHLLIEAGAQVDAASENGLTPIWVATESRMWRNVHVLLDAGATPDVNVFGTRSLLDLAVSRDAPEPLVLRLLDSGADPRISERRRYQRPLERDYSPAICNRLQVIPSMQEFLRYRDGVD